MGRNQAYVEAIFNWSSDQVEDYGQALTDYIIKNGRAMKLLLDGFESEDMETQSDAHDELFRIRGEIESGIYFRHIDLAHNQ